MNACAYAMGLIGRICHLLVDVDFYITRAP
jgi:hypothetical protein